MKPHHDLGGNIAGPVKPDIGNEPIFEQPWHKRVLGLTIATGAMGLWSIDSSRYWRESLPKHDYESFTYYEKWLSALVNLLVATKLITRNEIKESGFNLNQQSLSEKALPAHAVQTMLKKGSPALRSSTLLPIFSIGQIVRARMPSDTLLQLHGHTRLPYYIAGKHGKILFHHGSHVLPNSNAHFLGERPEPLYSVEFMSEDLWDDAKSGDSVIVDCWESYLEHAS